MPELFPVIGWFSGYNIRQMSYYLTFTCAALPFALFERFLRAEIKIGAETRAFKLYLQYALKLNAIVEVKEVAK